MERRVRVTAGADMGVGERSGCGGVDRRFLTPLRYRFYILVLDTLANEETRAAGVLPELHDSKAAFAQIADLFMLLERVVAAQSPEDAVEMSRLTALFVGDRGCQIADRLLADRAFGKLGRRSARFSVSLLSGSGFSVMGQALSILPVDVQSQILGDFAYSHGQILLVVDLFLQLRQPPRIRLFCYPNQNSIPVLPSS
jgi:hypothetical protein